MAEMCTHLATERARLVTLRLQLARPSSIPTTSGICERLGVKVPRGDSAGLLSLGAPFWFNTLKSLTNLCSVVATKESAEAASAS
jgi:hypothetical protein